MTVQTDIAAAIPADQLTDEVRAALVRLSDENALLRAALAETRARLGEAETGAASDALTELPNRRQFLRELERVVGQAERHGTPAALLAFDVRDLAGFNARHGRVAGDAALAHVARLLGGLIRTTDIAARIGGGRFALLLDHLDSDSAIDTGERIARCIADHPLDLGNGTASLEATVAVATILPGDSAADILARAERNLERLKDF